MSEQEKVEVKVEAKTEPTPSEITMGKIEALADKMEKDVKPEAKPAENVVVPPTEEKPKETPVAEPEKKAATPEVKPPSEDEDDLVPPEKRDNSWYARQRRKYQHERDERIKAEARLAEVEKQREQPLRQTPDQTPTPGNRESDVKASDVFRVYAKAKAGEFAGNPTLGLSADEQNVRVLQSSRAAIDKEFDVSELQEALDDAEKGLFGVYSEEIANAARQALPLALAREMKKTSTQQSEKEKFEASQAQRMTELRETVEKHPEFKDDKSPIFKHIKPWTDKWIGEFDAKGNLVKKGLMDPQVGLFVLQHPMMQAELVKQDYYSGQYSMTLAEKQRLETVINKSRQPESGGRPAGAESALGGSAAIKAKLEEQFGPVE